MKQKGKHKQQPPHVGLENDCPVRTVDPDYEAVYASDELSEQAPTPEPEEFDARAAAVRKLKEKAHIDNGDNRWTLPEAMEKVRREVSNYLPNSNAGWGALATKQFMSAAKQPGNADRIVALIRARPRSLLTNHGLVTALVELLEVAHFGTATDNRKLARSTARRALRLLSRSGQGNPPDYPPEFLANKVGLLQVAFAPITKAWAACHRELSAVRLMFKDEVKNFSDKELKSLLRESLLRDGLLMAAARLGERATGINKESFVTAWRKSPSSQQLFQANLPK
jgi:hypothetical protein